MKLYNVQRGSKIKILSEDYLIPPGAPPLKKGDELKFDHVDGMYSVCYLDGELVHLSANAEVEVLETFKWKNE